jgi:hypothetical protein
MATTTVVRVPESYVSTEVWDRQVALLLRNPANTEELAGRKFGQCIAYLMACGENPDLMLGPSAQVDEAWHSFMLDSVHYHHFTQARFGRYIHHVPQVREQAVDGRDSGTGGPLVLERTVCAIRAAGFQVDAELWGMEEAAECNQCHAGCHDSPK